MSTQPSTATVPRVSVIMAVYNAEAFLQEAIQSVCRQSFTNWEFIIVDDGSEDRTSKILKVYSDEDFRIRVLPQKRLGLTKSLNRAANMARGAFLARMDGDDVCLPDRFKSQIEYLESHPEVVAAGTSALFIDPDGDPIEDYEPPLSHEAIDRLHLSGTGGGIIHPSAMIRRNAFDIIGGYDEAFSTSQDYDLWLRLAEIGRLSNLRPTHLLYRLHLNSITFARRREQEKNVKAILEATIRRRGTEITLPEPSTIPRTADRSDDEVFSRRIWIASAFRAGYHKTARKHTAIVLRLRPFELRSWIHFVACRTGKLASFIYTTSKAHGKRHRRTGAK